MASYFIFAREYPPARFATFAALMLGIGSLGNLLASYPMAWAAETFGWRMSLGILGVLSIIVAVFIGLWLRDPARIEQKDGGSLLSVLRMPALWLLMPMMFVNYAPTGAIRGVWIGPYFTDVFGLGPEQVGIAGFVMGAAMILGSFAYGPLDRVFGTRKWVVFVGSALSALSLFALAYTVDGAPWISTALFASAGFFGACFPMIVAHGRAFFPPHLAGRGVTIMNLFGIGGVGIAQFVSGRFHGALAPTTDPATLYAMLFAGLGALVVFGLAFYAFSRDNMN
jgi:predicted MFS family arabinose efflux permease